MVEVIAENPAEGRLFVPSVKKSPLHLVATQTKQLEY